MQAATDEQVQACVTPSGLLQFERVSDVSSCQSPLLSCQSVVGDVTLAVASGAHVSRCGDSLSFSSGAALPMRPIYDSFLPELLFSNPKDLVGALSLTPFKLNPSVGLSTGLDTAEARSCLTGLRMPLLEFVSIIQAGFRGVVVHAVVKSAPAEAPEAEGLLPGAAVAVKLVAFDHRVEAELDACACICYKPCVNVVRVYSWVCTHTTAAVIMALVGRIEHGTCRCRAPFARLFRRVPKFSPYGSVCCACAQRPDLPRASPSRAR
jgi:hypothetical protein